VTEDFLTLYCDPGEDFGWCVGCGTKLLAAGTTKMWTMADDVWEALTGDPSVLLNEETVRNGIKVDDYIDLPIQRIVCEDFRIYPWKAKELAWDRVRTARVIGALTFMARVQDIPFILQPAAIKKAAQAAGAEELYYRPLHENRHQNDAIQHFVFFTNVELLGLNLPVPAENEEERS
jgi:hypothetical protein